MCGALPLSCLENSQILMVRLKDPKNLSLTGMECCLKVKVEHFETNIDISQYLAITE